MGLQRVRPYLGTTTTATATNMISLVLICLIKRIYTFWLHSLNVMSLVTTNLTSLMSLLDRLSEVWLSYCAIVIPVTHNDVIFLHISKWSPWYVYFWFVTIYYVVIDHGPYIINFIPWLIYFATNIYFILLTVPHIFLFFPIFFSLEPPSLFSVSMIWGFLFCFCFWFWYMCSFVFY